MKNASKYLVAGALAIGVTGLLVYLFRPSEKSHDHEDDLDFFFAEDDEEGYDKEIAEYMDRTW